MGALGLGGAERGGDVGGAGVGYVQGAVKVAVGFSIVEAVVPHWDSAVALLLFGALGVLAQGHVIRPQQYVPAI